MKLGIRLLIAFSFLAFPTFGQVITTIAGNGVVGYSGDGGPATSAVVGSTSSLAYDRRGNLYVLNGYYNLVRKIAPSGLISTVAGMTTSGYSGDGGLAIYAQIQGGGITVDDTGNLYIADKANSVVRKVDTYGIITTIAGNHTTGYSGDGGSALSAQLIQPGVVATDSAGNLFVGDVGVIRKVTPTGIITTYAGTGVQGFSGDGGAAISAQIHGAGAMCADRKGNLYFSDFFNNRIRKVDAAGIISTIVGGNVHGYSGDGGPASAAFIAGPIGLVVDTAGNLYFGDADNGRVRTISTAGIITTYAGNGITGYSGDNGDPHMAQIRAYLGLAIDTGGNIALGDEGRIRFIRKNGRPSQIFDISPATFQVYPNPCHGDCIIRLGNVTSEPISVTIVSAVGTVVYKSDKITGNQIHLEPNLASGIYFVNLVANSGTISGKLLIK